jgi:mevalonate kinase
MSERYYSHGKLLLTAEYLVVDGANALAVPCKFGQDLVVQAFEDSKELEISWKSYTNEGKLWFEGVFVSKEISSRVARSQFVIEPCSTSDDEVALKLASLLTKAFLLVNEIPKRKFDITTTLEFPQDWGLGSSSTLIVNIAKWLNINPYELFFAWTHGSGYDLACATAKSAIIYRKSGNAPVVENIDWNPPFKDEIYFLHLGQKQKSDREVKKYGLLEFNKTEAIDKVNILTTKMVQSLSLEEFETAIIEHERLISSVLERTPVKELLFSNYEGAVKSLGAWGGDFVMVTKRPNFDSYFKGKGYSTLLSFQDMIHVG